MNTLKTPLRYPGGKSRAVEKIYSRFPYGIKEYREPFLGGGSVACYIAQKHHNLPIWVNDLYFPLYNFWVQLRDNNDYVYKQLQQLKSRFPDPSSAKGLFLDAKEKLNDETTDLPDKAVCFYIINKCSFSGLTESSSFSPQASDSNFSMRGIEKMPYYGLLIKKWKITNLSYEELLDGDDAFCYLDPPYEIGSNLYGKKGAMHKGFDHDLFFTTCDLSKQDCLVSYNTTQVIKSRFLNWTASEFDLTYTMRSVGEYMNEQKQRKELLLSNY